MRKEKREFILQEIPLWPQPWMNGITFGRAEATAMEFHKRSSDSLFALKSPSAEFYKVAKPVLFWSTESEWGVFGHN